MTPLMAALDGTTQAVTLALGVAGVVAAIYGLVRWARPKLQQGEAVGAAILGRVEVRDRSGAVIQPAVPGMVAQVAALTDVVEKIADSHQRIESLEQARREHGNRIQALEDAAVERVAGKVEAIHTWRAVAALAADEDAELP